MGTIFQFPYRTVVEISIPSLMKNLYTLRTISQREVIPVIKADAYGHGMLPIGRALLKRGSCHTLAVATLEEAIDLRKHLPHGLTILVLSGFFPHQLEAYTKYRLVPVLHTLNHLRSLLGRKQLPEFHLKLDTGMHRLGLTEDQIGEAIKLLEKMEVKLAGVETHLAESESALSTFADEQLEVFDRMLTQLRENRLVQTDAKIHVANSGGILRAKWGKSVAVRPGLSLYGISPNPRLARSSELIPILEWKTRIIAVKDLKRNDTVGYGRTYKAKRKEKIAILPIGYADGYPRLLSNVGEVLLAGKRVPVRGIVSMDLTAIDCTQIPTKEGALVTLIGGTGKESLSIWELANWAQTLPYEVFCGISARVPRVYLD